MNKVTIIAEAGINHNGSFQLAKKLIDIASEAKVDYVKFQTFKAKSVISKNAKKAEYQIKNTSVSESQYEMAKKLEFDEKTHIKLIEYCHQRNVQFLSSPFDLESIDLLYDLGIKLFKIPSGEITNYPYLKKIATKKFPVILSSGMSNLSDIEAAINVLTANGLVRKQITVLHCNTGYPTPMKDVNLNAMNTIKKSFKVSTGYSDHTLGIEVPIAAVAKGARVIEKHYTIDKTMEGPDHRASLEPEELIQMVNAIRNIEVAMGSGIKEASLSEKKNIEIVRKSIVASKPVKTGEMFTDENIAAKRPGNGISPMKWNYIIGTKALRDYNIDELIDFT